jgi:aryl-alcohol dehydrogenase-like predicted oxidoreductase
MPTRSVSGTELRLSVMGFGCWTLGGRAWGPVDDQVSVRAVHAALDAGVNWFDTAPLYGHGHSDRILARALGNRRHQVVIATKVGVRIQGEHAESDLSPGFLKQDCDASLRRLGVERIDLLQVHWPCERGTPLEETLGALQDLQTQGKIRNFGLCNYAADTLRRARALGPVATLQTPLNLLRREFEGPLGQASRGMGVLAYEPLCRGLLSGRFDRFPDFGERDIRARDPRFSGARFLHARGLVRDLNRVAKRLGLPLPALAIAWVAMRPGVTAALVGCRTPEQVRQNVQAVRLLNRPQVWSIVDRILAVHGGWTGSG